MYLKRMLDDLPRMQNGIMKTSKFQLLQGTKGIFPTDLCLRAKVLWFFFLFDWGFFLVLLKF